MKIIGIVAISQNNVIGDKGKLLWYLPKDLKHFRQLTSGHAVLMGRKTFESIGRTLPNRLNIVLSKQGYPYCESIEKAIAYAKGLQMQKLFVIGGVEIYNLAMPYVDKWCITKVDAYLQGDTSIELPNWKWERVRKEFWTKDQQNQYNMTYFEYLTHNNHENH